MICARTPRRASWLASISPVGPAPTIRTSVSMRASPGAGIYFTYGPAAARSVRTARLLARCRVASLDDDVLDDPRACATERGGFAISIRLEAADRGFHGRKLDDDEAMKSLRPFHDLVPPAARE